MSLTSLSTYQIALLAIMPKIGSITVQGLVTATNWTEARLRTELQGLVAAGEVAHDAYTDLYRLVRCDD